MISTFNFELLALGALGALLHEATRWVGLRQASRLPAYLYRVHYWLLSGVLALMGGVLAALLNPTTVAQALAIGVAGPALISRLASTLPRELHLAHGDSMIEEDGDVYAWLRS